LLLYVHSPHPIKNNPKPIKTRFELKNNIADPNKILIEVVKSANFFHSCPNMQKTINIQQDLQNKLLTLEYPEEKDINKQKVRIKY